MNDNHKNTLMAMLDKGLADAGEAYQEARDRLIEGWPLANKLPEFLTATRWWVFTKTDENKWYMETNVIDATEGDELVRQLRLWGVYGLKSDFKTYSNAWTYRCTAMIGDIELSIKVDGGSKPANCRIEETVEMREVTVYKAICPETGEEL